MHRRPYSQKRLNGGGPHKVQAQPLAPGTNRFQPSAAYLASSAASQPQRNLAPATAPSSWPPVPEQQQTGPAQASAAARWVEDQQTGRGSTASAASGSSAARWLVEADAADAARAYAAEPAAPRLPSPSPLVSALLADVDDDELYGGSADAPLRPAATGRSPSSPPLVPHPPAPAHSVASSARCDVEPRRPLSPPPRALPTATEAALADFVPLVDSEDDGADSEESDDERIQEQLLGVSARAVMRGDSDEELLSNGVDSTEVLILDDSDVDPEHGPDSAYESSSDEDDRFDLVIDSEDDDAPLEIVECDSTEMQAAEKRASDDSQDKPNRKRRRLSSAADSSVEDGEIAPLDVHSASRWLSPDPESSAEPATAAGGLSRLFSFGSPRQSRLLTSATTAISAPTAGLLSRVFAAGRSVESSTEAHSASEKSAPAVAADASIARPSDDSRRLFRSAVESSSRVEPSAPMPLPVAIPQARDRASYQRRIEEPGPTLSGSGASASAKAIYFRPSNTTTVPRTTAAPPQRIGSTHLPFAAAEKSLTLPAKLAAEFPTEFSDEPPSTHIFQPATLATATAKSLPPPDKNAHFGFWPAPPPLLSGKGVFPPPRPQPGAIAPENDTRPPVHIFIDNSNVLYAFLDWLRARPEAKVVSVVSTAKDGRSKATKTVTLGGRKVKMDYPALFALLERGRRVEKRILVASSALSQSLEPAIDWGYEISLLQRVHRPAPESAKSKNVGAAVRSKGVAPSGCVFVQQRKASGRVEEPRIYKEQAVDELVNMKMLESLLDYTPSPSSAPPTLVLVSGDAKNAEFNPSGFLGCVRRALDRGWNVEVMSFASTTSAAWAMEQAKPRDDGRGSLRIVDLEKFAEELVL